MELNNRSGSLSMGRKTLWLVVLQLLLVIAFTGYLISQFSNGIFTATSYYQVQEILFIKLNGAVSQWPLLWLNITELGDALIFFPLVSFLIFYSPRTWAALFGAVPLSGILSTVGKNLFSVPRPAAVLDHSQFNIVGQTLSAHTSLPSGHTITAVAICTVLAGATILSKRFATSKILIALGIFVIGFLAAFSRVAVGAHWPFDVLVGTSLGIIGGVSGLYLVQKYKRWWSWLESRNGQMLFSFIMLAWAGHLFYKSYSSNIAFLFIHIMAAVVAMTASTHILIAQTIRRSR